MSMSGYCSYFSDRKRSNKSLFAIGSTAVIPSSVAHDRVRRRSSSLRKDLFLATKIRDVGDHQKISGELFHLDDAKFFFESRFDLSTQRPWTVTITLD
jgi:hypothetical protein